MSKEVYSLVSSEEPSTPILQQSSPLDKPEFCKVDSDVFANDTYRTHDSETSLVLGEVCNNSGTGLSQATEYPPYGTDVNSEAVRVTETDKTNDGSSAESQDNSKNLELTHDYRAEAYRLRSEADALWRKQAASVDVWLRLEWGTPQYREAQALTDQYALAATVLEERAQQLFDLPSHTCACDCGCDIVAEGICTPCNLGSHQEIR